MAAQHRAGSLGLEGEAELQYRLVSNLVLYSIPVFIIAMVIEGVWARGRAGIMGYEKRDTAASISMGLLNVIVSGATKLLSIPFFVVLYEHRIVDIGSAWWAWIVLLFAEDFCYYW